MNIKLPFPRRSVASRGKAIYQKKILPLIYPQEKGKIVVIDISSGDYEIDADDAQALVRLLARHPHARPTAPSPYSKAAGLRGIACKREMTWSY